MDSRQIDFFKQQCDRTTIPWNSGGPRCLTFFEQGSLNAKNPQGHYPIDFKNVSKFIGFPSREPLQTKARKPTNTENGQGHHPMES